MNTQRLFSLTLAFALLGLLPLAVTAQTEKKGKLEIVEQYDWGTIAPGQLQADIEIKNVGEGVLTIDTVRPSCGCTTAPLDDKVLKPGESTLVHVSLNASHSKGSLRKSMTVYSDDPNNPTKYVQLIANIYAPSDVTFTPDNRWIIFNNAVVGQEVETSPIVIKNTSDKPITIYPPQFSGTDVAVVFNISEEKILQPGEEMELTGRVKADKPMKVEEKVSLRTSAPNNAERVFTLFGHVGEASATSTQTSSIKQ